MKKTRIIVMAAVMAAIWMVCGEAAAQGKVPESFAGRWWLGILSEGQLPLNITFERLDAYDEAGERSRQLTPVVYSPAQTKEALYPTKWSMDGDTLRFMHSRTGVNLRLIWDADDSSFSGQFKQGYMRTSIKFEQSKGMFSPVRPQDPIPPYPYTEEDVTIVCKSGVTLTGTLTLPEEKYGKSVPAVVLVSGSGQQNRDEELMFHRPFKVLADYLTRAGIAVLRYDDRGVGGSRGEVRTATTDDFSDDAEEVLRYLSKHKRVDPKRVGMVGHSEGALIACMVASRNKAVKYVVLLGGQSGTGAEVLLQQNEQLFKAMGVPQNLVDVRLQCMKAIFAAADSVPPERYEKKFVQIMDKVCGNLTNEERKQISMRRADAAMWAQQISLPWMKRFLELDNGRYLEKMKQPVLAVTGEKDLQVPPVNLGQIKSRTKGRAEIHEMPQLNHLMQHCKNGLPEEYMSIDETFSPEVMDLITKWVLSR